MKSLFSRSKQNQIHSIIECFKAKHKPSFLSLQHRPSQRKQSAKFERRWRQFATPISRSDWRTSTLSSLLTETPSNPSQPPQWKPRDLNVTFSTFLAHLITTNLGFTLFDTVLNLSRFLSLQLNWLWLKLNWGRLRMDW